MSRQVRKKINKNNVGQREPNTRRKNKKSDVVKSATVPLLSVGGATATSWVLDRAVES